MAPNLARMANGDTRLDGCGQNLDRELQALQTWYSAFGFALMSGGALPPPNIHDDEDARQLLSCVRDGAHGGGKATVNAALALLLASQHLDNTAAEVSADRRGPCDPTLPCFLVRRSFRDSGASLGPSQRRVP